MMNSKSNRDDPAEAPPLHPAWPLIEKAIGKLRFGEVTLIVHDGVIEQVNRLEMTRLQGTQA